MRQTKQAVQPCRKQRLTIDTLFRAAERKSRRYIDVVEATMIVQNGVDASLARETMDPVTGQMQRIRGPENAREANIVRHYGDRVSKGMPFRAALDLALSDMSRKNGTVTP